MTAMSTVKVGLDFTPVLYDRGVSRYTHNLILSLIKKNELQVSLWGSSFRQKNTLQNLIDHQYSSSLPFHLASYPPAILSWIWKFGFSKVRKFLPQIEVFHSWDWLQPPDQDLPLVSTIHDLAILKFPETAHPKILKMHQRSWKILKDRQAEIIAVSGSTKEDIVSLLNIPAERVHVVYEALPRETSRLSKEIDEDAYNTIKDRLKLDKPYLLFVGTREPRKNLTRLIKAWLPLAKDYQLIIAGEKGWDESTKLLDKAPIGQLRFLGKVSNQELAILYGEAQLLAFPSLYEGFGLPILEAFHHGTPVVTSNVSSMPEVAGNAAELVDPNSIKSIEEGLRNVLNESPLQQKKRLQQMIIRLHLFSWQRVAAETTQVYKTAILRHQQKSA
jgi:glycosyltransferase involved in cell wall biosynthesis